MLENQIYKFNPKLQINEKRNIKRKTHFLIQVDIQPSIFISKTWNSTLKKYVFFCLTPRFWLWNLRPWCLYWHAGCVLWQYDGYICSYLELNGEKNNFLWSDFSLLMACPVVHGARDVALIHRKPNSIFNRVLRKTTENKMK